MKKRVQTLMLILTNSCKKTTELIEKKSITSLSLEEKVKLKLHTSMCNTCHAYQKQSKFLDNAYGMLLNTKQPHNMVELSKDRKSKILEKLKNNDF